jgi:predicted nucleic acid-binding Zn ribbon protein
MRRVAHVGDVVRSFLRGAHLEKEMARWQVVLSWPRIVGAEVAAHSEALELRNQILWVAVPSSSWRQHILFLKPQILSAFRREHPGVPVADVRCVTSARRSGERPRNEGI